MVANALHSPFPWKTGAAGEDAELIYDAEDNIVASTEDTSKFSRSAETEARENANAAMIVRAVNSHGALLELAKQHASECGDCNGSGRDITLLENGEYGPDIDCETCADIRAVIAKALGGT